MDLFELRFRWWLVLCRLELLSSVLDLIISFLPSFNSFILLVRFHENVTVLCCNVFFCFMYFSFFTLFWDIVFCSRVILRL